MYFFLHFFSNYFVANTCRYSKTKKCEIKPKIKATIYYYNKLYLKKLIFAYIFSFSCIFGYAVKIFKISNTYSYGVFDIRRNDQDSRTKDEGRKFDIA